MTVDDTRADDCLDTLMQTCRESELGFRHCAGHAQSLRLQWLLTQRAQRCRKCLAELRALRNEISTHALPPLRCDDAAWAAPDKLLESAGDATLLAECERGEEITLQRYRRVLDEDLPILLRAVAQRHLDATKGHRAQLRRLRVQCEAAPAALGARHRDVEAA